MWRTLADIAAKMLEKGRLISVEGKKEEPACFFAVAV
jgi:single-stranded DNA-binding protein